MGASPWSCSTRAAMPDSSLATDQGEESPLSATSKRTLQTSIPITSSTDFDGMALSPNLVDTGLVSQATVRVHQRNGMTTCAERRAETHRTIGLSCRASHYLECTIVFPSGATGFSEKGRPAGLESEPLIGSYKDDKGRGRIIA